MPRFQLVFRDARGERSEIHDNNLYDEPRIDGKLIVDGETYRIGGFQWVIRSEERIDGMARFICFPAIEQRRGGSCADKRN